MAINEADYDAESELETWIRDNIQSFLPGSLFIPGFQIATTSGKTGVPDGFAFNFRDREWYVIECELLVHGVWPHIAEQITRFVVALQNPQSIRRIRDRLFDHILATDSLRNDAAAALETSAERLLHQMELFVEGVDPQLVIFIDKTDQDLKDMADALATKTRIFKVQKFIVNGSPEYHCPDKAVPIVETQPVDHDVSETPDFDIIDLLGGGTLEATARRFKCYRLTDGSLVHIKRSKLYQAEQSYWYGISTASLAHMRNHKLDFVILVMSDFGFVKVPMSIIEKYIETAYTSSNPDGSIRHYHLYMSHGPAPELRSSKDQPTFPLAEYFHPFD